MYFIEKNGRKEIVRKNRNKSERIYVTRKRNLNQGFEVFFKREEKEEKTDNNLKGMNKLMIKKCQTVCIEISMSYNKN